MDGWGTFMGESYAPNAASVGKRGEAPQYGPKHANGPSSRRAVWALQWLLCPPFEVFAGTKVVLGTLEDSFNLSALYRPQQFSRLPAGRGLLRWSGSTRGGALAFVEYLESKPWARLSYLASWNLSKTLVDPPLPFEVSRFVRRGGCPQSLYDAPPALFGP